MAKAKSNTEIILVNSAKKGLFTIDPEFGPRNLKFLNDKSLSHDGVFGYFK